MEEIMISILQTGIAFFLLMIISLCIGKQVKSHNNHYNFALSVTISTFIANMGFAQT